MMDYYKNGNKEVELVGFMDSDFTGDRDRRRSIFAYAFTLCWNRIGWRSHLQCGRFIYYKS